VTTAYRWYREGTLPVPARKAVRLVLVSPDVAALPPAQGGAGLYARVSSHDQKAGLDRQVARLYGRRPARNRALKAVGCAQRDIGPQAVLAAGSTPCGGAG
jgi:predicted site-specific integrase-resolvase